MTTTAVKPGLDRPKTPPGSPYTPIGYVNGTPVYALAGARSGGGISFQVGDDEDNADADTDDDDDLPASMRGRPGRERGRRPARRGTQPDDDDDDAGDTDADDDDDDAEDADTDADGWQPPTREAVERMEAALRKANREAAKRRTLGKTMQKLGIDDLEAWLAQRGIDPTSGRPYGNDVVDPDDLDPGDDTGQDDPVDDSRPTDRTDDRTDRRDRRRPANDREIARSVLAAERRAEQRALDKFVPILAQTQATNALREAGFHGTKEQLELALRMIDPRAIDVLVEDDEFEVDGLDEQVEEIKERFPSLFKDPDEPVTRRNRAPRDDDGGGTRRPARRTGARDVDGGDRGRQTRTLGWKEQVAEQMKQRGRR